MKAEAAKVESAKPEAKPAKVKHHAHKAEKKAEAKVEAAAPAAKAETK